MKQILLFSFVFLYLHSYSQQKDRRKYIGDEIIFSSFKVSSSGEIWMANNKNELFFSESIDSSWKEIKFSEENKFRPSLTEEENEIILFDKNGIIIPAIIRDTNFHIIDGLAISRNKGITWEFVAFPKKIYLNNISIDKNKILQGFHSNKSKLEIYISADFGKTWTKQKTSSKLKDDIVKEMHTSSGQGILILKNNKIYVTNSNWKKAKEINHEKIDAYYNILTRYFDSYLVKNIEVFKDFYIMHYENRIYCTRTDKIQWKPINYEISCYDSDSSKIVAVTTDGELLTYENFESNEPILKLKPKKIKHDYKYDYNYEKSIEIQEIKIVGKVTYIIQFDRKIVQIVDGNYNYLEPYTTQQVIPNPRLQKKGENLVWAVEDNHIYISEDNGLSWYREAVAKDFEILEFNLLNDSTAIFWTDLSGYMEYYLKKHKFKGSKYKFQFESFQKYPIETLTISYTNRQTKSTIKCQIKDSLTLSCKCELIYQKDTIKTTNEILIDTLVNQLNLLQNKTESRLGYPISRQEIKEYITFYENNKSEIHANYRIRQLKDMLNYDTIYKARLGFNHVDSKNIFKDKFEISLTNKNKDTLNLLRFPNQNYHFQSDSNGDYYRSDEKQSELYIFQNNIYLNGPFLYFVLSCFPDDFRKVLKLTNFDIYKVWVDDNKQCGNN